MPLPGWIALSLVLAGREVSAAQHKTFAEAQAAAKEKNRPLLLYLSSD